MGSQKYMTSPPNLTGMPPGVPYIIGNEAAERFSYYGMKSVLTVFMAHYILNQSGLLAPMQENEAYMYTHYFVFGVYFLPILGAILADGHQCRSSMTNIHRGFRIPDNVIDRFIAIVGEQAAIAGVAA